jgi:phage-related protein
MIIWAGTSNKDVGMIVEHYPGVVIPQRKQEVQTVPGRNGEIILTDSSFSNYQQSYRTFLDAKYLGGLEQVMPKMVDWLLGHEGYHRLEDSYFPDVYRMAYYSGGTEFVSFFNEYGEGTLTFTCAPEKYYKSGEREIILTQGQVLRNPSSFAALPLLYITGNESSNGTLSFNNKSITITAAPTSLTIDIKNHKAYSGSLNCNNKITGLYEDLKLEKETQITWSGGIQAVRIIPRWWTI